MTLRQHLSREHEVSVPKGQTADFLEQLHRMIHKSEGRTGHETHTH